MADDATHAATATAAGEDRQEAISEILAELRGDTVPEHEPRDDVSNEPGPAAEPPDDSGAGPDGGEQDEDPEPAAGPSQGEPSATPEPRQRPAATASPRPLPQASTPRTLVLLHACFLLLISILVWLGYRQVAVALHAVKDAVAPRQVAAAAGLPAAPAPRHAPGPAAPADPVLKADEGLRYVQEVEKADLLFDKGQHLEAAGAYRRALDVMPTSWNDGAAAFRLGECYFHLRDYTQAVAAYERVAAAYRGRFKPRALFQLGEAYLCLEAYAKARTAFYDLLLQQKRYEADAPQQIQKAYYRIADCYRLEAASVGGPGEGAAR